MEKLEYTSKRNVNGCQIIKKIVGNRKTFKCKNMKRPPTAQEIINDLKKK